MAKRTYRARKINTISADEFAGIERIIVGIDVAKTRQMAAITDADTGEVLTIVTFESPWQDADFVELLVNIDAQIAVAMEPTGSYSTPLRASLWQAGLEVFQTHPTTVARMAEFYDHSRSSHDAKAACVIAFAHRCKPGRRWPLRDDDDRQLRAATRRVLMLKQDLQRGLGRLEAWVAVHWPELTTIMALTSATVLTLLAEFGDRQAVWDNPERAAQCMKKAGRQTLDHAKVERILESAHVSTGLDCVPQERAVIIELATEQLRLRTALSAAQRQLKDLGRQHDTANRLSDTVGMTTAVMLTVLMGDARDYPDAASYLKATGLNLIEYSSGKQQGALRISRRGNSKARHLLFLAALRLIQRDALTRAWYDQRLADNGGIKRKAIVAVMRKLTRALWAMAQHGRAFDSRLLFDEATIQRERRRRGLPRLTLPDAAAPTQAMT